MGQAYGQKPSDLLGIEDPWAAFQLDMACLSFGTWVESKLSETNKKGKPKHQLSTLLMPLPREEDEGKRGAPASGFRSLSSQTTRKVRIGEDGIW
jgi:hypothetical protein